MNDEDAKRVSGYRSIGNGYNTRFPPLGDRTIDYDMLLGAEEDKCLGYSTVGYGAGWLTGAHVGRDEKDEEDEEDKYARPRYGLPAWTAPPPGASHGHMYQNAVNPLDDKSDDGELVSSSYASPGPKPPPPSPAAALGFALPPSMVELSPVQPLVTTPVCPGAPERPLNLHSMRKSPVTPALEKRFDDVVDLQCHEVVEFVDELINQLTALPQLQLPPFQMPPLQLQAEVDDVEDDLAAVHRGLSVEQTNVALAQLALHAAPQAAHDAELEEEPCYVYRSVCATAP